MIPPAPAALRTCARAVVAFGSGLGIIGCARAEAPVTTVSTATVWQDNVTNARSDEYRTGTWALTARAGADQRRSLSRDDALFLGADLAAEVWPRFDGLDQLAVGPRGAWQHKFGLGAYAPTVRGDLAVQGLVAREHARAGWQGQAALGYGQRFTEAFRFDCAADFARTDARAAVFTRNTAGLTAGASYDFNARWRLSARLGWHHGDALSYARAVNTYYGWRPVSGGHYAPGTPALLVPTFNEPYLAYRVHAHTWSYATGLSPALGPHTALSLQVERAETTGVMGRYVNHLFTITWAGRF